MKSDENKAVLKTESIVSKVTDLAEAVLADMGFELVDVEYLVDRGRWVLRIYMDGPGGVSIDDCARVSREIGVLVDVQDFIPQEYVLEVSSPGLNRRLKKGKDFEWAVGKKVKIRMKDPIGGRRSFTGYLTQFRDAMIFLTIGNDEVTLPFQGVERANLVYEFDQ